MKLLTHSLVVVAFASLACLGQNVNAGTINDSSFDLAPSNKSVQTAGLLDWGYFINGADFGDGTQVDVDWDDITDNGGSFDPATNSKAVSGIGAVEVVAETTAPTTAAPFSGYTFTFDDGLAPVSGTGVATDGVAGGIASGESSFTTLQFNDLGAGMRLITLFLGHTASNRQFRANLELTAADGNDSEIDLTGTIGDGGADPAFTYQILVTSSDPLADLSITFDSITGSTGAFQFAGYTVESVPAPAALPAGLAIMGLLALRRRRRIG